MYRKILVGFQGTEQGRDALALGEVLARATGAEMLVAAGLDSGSELAALAGSEEADLVVLGPSHRGGLGRIVPGTTAAHLLSGASCAIAVAPPRFARAEDDEPGWRPLGGDGDAGMRVIGVGFDGSTAAREALAAATGLALRNGAALRVYTVAQRYAHLPTDPNATAPTAPSLAAALQEQLHTAVRALPAEARALPVFLRGFAAEELLRACESGVDLLVLGSRAGGPLRRTLHSSVSDHVLRGAPCPVLISPAGVAAPEPVPA